MFFWQRRLYSIQDEHVLEKNKHMEMKTTYSLILAEMEAPLLQMEEDAMRIRAIHEEHSEVSIYNESRH